MGRFSLKLTGFDIQEQFEIEIDDLREKESRFERI